MKMEIRAFLLLLIFLYSSYSTLALYEDQVGLMDWYPSLSRYLYMLIYYLVFCTYGEFDCLQLYRNQQYIGKVKHAVFHTQKAARKRVVVATEENVVASLDLRHGEICEFYCFSVSPSD